MRSILRVVSQAPLLLEIGRKVRALRKERRLTMQQLADAAALSSRFVGELEAGRANISVLNLAHVAEVVGVKLTTLVELEAPQRPAGVISLLGLRGAGKSTVGAALAKKLAVPFVELDRLVETEAGMSASELFSMHGEAYFREREAHALRRFLDRHRHGVVAAGGGLVTSPETFELLLAQTATVWLKASPDDHWQRVVRQGDLRPMQNRPRAKAELRKRLKEREPLYARARLTCDTSGRSVDHVVAQLASWARPPDAAISHVSKRAHSD